MERYITLFYIYQVSCKCVIIFIIQKIKKKEDSLKKSNANQKYSEVSPHTLMAMTKMPTINKRYRECGEKGTLLHCSWKCKLVQPL